MSSRLSLEQILRDLVAIDSVSSLSNVEITRYLHQTLESIGCAVTELRYRDDHGIVKVNLVGILGPSRDVLGAGGLALSVHSDTPPYDPSWRDALILTRRDGQLFGRGVCSCKGFAAAAIEAAATVDLSSMERPLALVFTADGELGGLGARRLAENKTVTPISVIVGEPTGNKPACSHKGYCMFEIDVEGREVHSSYAHLGTNAVHRAAELIQGLQRIGAELEKETNPAFDPPYSSLNVGVVQAGRAPNLVPGHCHVVVECRPTSDALAEQIGRMIRKEVDTVRERTGGLPIRVNQTRAEPPVSVPTDTEIVRFFKTKTGHEASSVPFASELAAWITAGAEGVIFGPGDIREVRHDSECVPEKELRRASDLFARAIEHWCFYS